MSCNKTIGSHIDLFNDRFGIFKPSSYYHKTLFYSNLQIQLRQQNIACQILYSNNYSYKNMNNFDQIAKTRYAQMQSSILNKSNGLQTSPNTNKLNLTGKFALLQEKACQIENEAHVLTQAARQSSRLIEQMKRVVAQKELGEYKLKCWQQVKKYEKVVTYGISENEKRSQHLQSKCKQLNQSTEQLKSTITSLHTRINRLQNVLGYYSGAEIVSNY